LAGVVLVCRLFGHRWRFAAKDETMRWTCTRGCGAGGEKRYESAERAARYARALDREDRDDLGRRPLLSLLPLALARRAGRDGDSGHGSAR
jgi:hypothetical protein